MARTAAMCMAVGKVSLEDWDILMSSLGCSRRFPARAFPRPAMTSLAFMLDWVPEPVCQTTRGKLSPSAPEITSSAAWEITVSFSPVIFSGFRTWFAMAAAFFRMPKAWMISRGMVSSPTPMGKLFRLRSVCAPQYLSAGTRTSPIESCSMRYSIFLLLCGFLLEYHIRGKKKSGKSAALFCCLRYFVVSR